jgi:outer membrane protein OmpA-like peptidoglycan-associated protein/tetratricopeptide (TPR) repeat protein
MVIGTRYGMFGVKAGMKPSAGRAIRYFCSIILGIGILPLVMAQAEGDRANEQCAKPEDKKILKLLEEAGKAKDPAGRHQKLRASLELDPQCAECLFRTGISAFRIARETGRGFEPAIKYLSELHALCPEYHADVPYHLGLMHYNSDQFAEAAKAFTEFQRFPIDNKEKLPRDHEKKLKDVEEIMPELAFYVDFYRNDIPFNPKSLANVNTAAEEYLPMLSPDNELLLFTRLSKVKGKGDIVSRDVEELMEARRTTPDEFNAGRALPEPFNVGDSYGGVTISVNNKEMFVTICGPADARGYRNCDIFRTQYTTYFDTDKGWPVYEWMGLENLGPNINTPDGWESQPSLSSDGRTLYFATQRENTRGMDIYQSTRDEKGNWAPAIPVPGINTDGDEKAPFMHSDSRTLYFAARPPSDDPGRGHRGAGGYDIFYSRMNEDGSWGKPKNIGHPINTDQDEHGLVVSTDGRTAYFASNRFKGAGGLDIYSFSMPQDARPEDILVVKGEVRDEKGELVRDAQVEIKYMDSRKVELINVDNEDGRYATVVKLRSGGNVVLTVKKEDHVFDSRSFSLLDTAKAGVAVADMTVQKIEVGRSYRVNDINFPTNSAEIGPGSEFVLNELIGFLKENPRIKIRIDGHTDNVGGHNENMNLSNQRANTVMDYLKANGISGERLSAKGFGPTVPVASNDTPEGRARNRRTEFLIIGK